MEELTGREGKDFPRVAQTGRWDAHTPAGILSTDGERQRAMELKNEAISLPPLIDFGETYNTISSPTHSENSNHIFLKFESSRDDLVPTSACSVSSESTASPAESSSSPLSGKQLEGHYLGSWSQRAIFDAPEFTKTSDGSTSENLSNTANSKARILNQSGSVDNEGFLSAMFATNSPASSTSETKSVLSPQTDLLSGDVTLSIDSALSMPRTPSPSLHSPLALNSGSQQTHSRSDVWLSQGSSHVSPQTPYISNPLFNTVSPQTLPFDTWPSHTSSHASPQTPYVSKFSPQDRNSVSNERRNAVANPVDRSFASPLIPSKDMKDSFASASVDAGDSQGFWSWPFLEPDKEQIKQETQTLSHRVRTSDNKEAPELLVDTSSDTNSCKSPVSDSLKLVEGEAWLSEGSSHMSPQNSYTSTPYPQDTKAVSEELPRSVTNCFDRSFESPFMSKAVDSMKHSFANMSVDAGDSPDFWSWPYPQPYGEQIGQEMQTLPINVRTDDRREALELFEDRTSDTDSCKSPVSYMLDLRGADLSESIQTRITEELMVPVAHWISDNGHKNCQSGSDSIGCADQNSGRTDIGTRESFEQGVTCLKESPSAATGRCEYFVAAGGGKGIFKVPVNGAVHPDRPVSLELRPRPLTETQSNHLPRVLVCTDTSVWSVCTLGILVWDIKNAGRLSCDGRGNMKGDEDAAAYTLLPVSGLPPTCLFPDTASGIMWSGHKDGRVRAWPMGFNHDNETACSGKVAVLDWRAHQTAVLAIVMTSYGELWTGSENGSIRAWPWDATANAISCSGDSLLTAAATVATSYIDLRSRGAAAGASSILLTDVQFLVAEHSTCRVWSGGSHSLALWDARTRDILKVFGANADTEFSSPNISPVREAAGAEEGKVNFTKNLKREKSQGMLSFFQRSRNAVIGAADAVLRAAVGGQSMDDSKKIEALVASSDGKMWVGYANGCLAQWNSCGSRLAEFHHTQAAVRCMCAFGSRIFVGYADGMVHVLGIETGKFLGAWHAHRSAVARMGIGDNHLFTLAEHGGIRGWFITTPSPLDMVLHSNMVSKESSFTRHENFKILAGTWNVGQEKASFQSLKLWLGRWSGEASIIVVGLQEVEMGAGALAMAAAKETVGLAGSVNGQWWLDNISNALNGGKVFERVASRQLAGLLIGVWVKKGFLPFVGDVDVGAVACGFGRAFGNKGAVAVKMMVFRRTVCVVNCHFAAHMDAVAKRNADFEHIYHRMTFGRSFGAGGVAATAITASTVPIIRGDNIRQDTSSLETQDILSEKISAISSMETQLEDVVAMPELSDADLIIWIGDFNYRLEDLSYADAISMIAHKQWGDLVKYDQLRSEMRAGRVFQGMREACICFPPTYKFDKGYMGSSSFSLGYDSSEKRRVPAWCDRILFRDSFGKSSFLQKPCLAHPIAASVAWYAACMEAGESDHKPVSCLLDVEVAAINEAARRWEYGRFMSTDAEVLSLQKQIDAVPETVVNTNNLKLLDLNMTILKVTNKSGQCWAVFNVYCEGEPTGSSCPCNQNHNNEKREKSCKGCFGFPSWLQVWPASGVLRPGQTLELSLQHAGREVLSESDISCRQPTWWADGEQGKVVILVVEVKGVLSFTSKEHRICVCHSLSNCGEDPHNHRQREIFNGVLATGHHDTRDILWWDSFT